MAFDSNAFLQQAITEANDTVPLPVPEGFYTGIINDKKVKEQTSADGLKTYYFLEIIWEVDDEDVRQLLGRDEVTCRQSILLDVTETGQLKTGRGVNVGLGRLRSAVGLNTPGEPFTLDMLNGKAAQIKIGHTPGKSGADAVYSNVVAVAKFA